MRGLSRDKGIMERVLFVEFLRCHCEGALAPKQSQQSDEKNVSSLSPCGLPVGRQREGWGEGVEAMNTSKIIYSINIEDVQNVAEEKLGRKLADNELKIIEDKIGDYIDWYSAIDMALQNEVLH